MRPEIQLLFIASLLAIGGCTVQEKYWEKESPVFIEEDVKEHIKSTKVVINIDQDSRLGIPVLGQRTSHQYYGVLGKLAESEKIRFEKDSSDEQRNLLRGVDKAAFRFDTGIKFRMATEKNLEKIPWLNVTSIVNQTDLQISEIERMVKTLDEDVLLVIDNRYLMANDFRSITVLSQVNMYAHNETLAKLAKAAKPFQDPPTLYKNLFLYEHQFEGSYTTANEALKGWSSNDGDMVRRAISQSITDLSNQLITDLSYRTVKK